MNHTDTNERLITFRIENYKKLLQELDACAHGFHRPLSPFFTNKSGEYSERKLQTLINRLVSGLEQYYPVYLDAPYLCHNNALYYFYKSFLYCTIRACSTPFTLYSDGNELGVYYPDLTFGDIVEVLQPEQFEIVEDGESCALCYPIYNTLSLILPDLYRILSGQQLFCRDHLTGEIIPLSARDKKTDPAPENTPEEMRDSGYAFTSDAVFGAEASYYAQYETELADRIREEEQKLLETFPHASVYCRNYEQLQRLFPKYYRREVFGDHIRFMIEHFLTEQYDTVFDDEDAYVTMLVYLQKNIQTLKG